MASSVNHTGGSLSFTTSMPSSASDRTFWGWAKPNAGEYGGGAESIVVGMGTSGGSSEGLLLDCGISANTIMSAVAFRNGGSDLQSVNFRTGSSTAWFAWFWRIAAGSATCEFGWRLENQTTWTKTNLTLGAAIPMTGGGMYLGTDQFAENARDSNTRGFFCQAALLTDGQLLTATQNINSAPAGTNIHSLIETNAATANVSTGSAGNWVISPTLNTASNEPTESLGAAGVILRANFVPAPPPPPSPAIVRGFGVAAAAVVGRIISNQFGLQHAERPPRPTLYAGSANDPGVIVPGVSSAFLPADIPLAIGPRSIAGVTPAQGGPMAKIYRSAPSESVPLSPQPIRIAGFGQAAQAPVIFAEALAPAAELPP